MNTQPEPPNQVVTTDTEPAVLGAKTRILRTVLQVIAALAVAIPSLAAAFNMTAANTGKVTAAMGLITVIASIVHNTYDATQASPVANRDAGNATIGMLLRLFALVAFIIVGCMGAGWIFDSTVHLFAWLGFGLAAWMLSGFVDAIPSHHTTNITNRS